MKRAKTVAGYVAAAPAGARGKLRRMRACVRAAAPEAVESVKWGMPAFSQGRILVMFAAFKRHIGFFPMPSALKAFAKELKPFVTGKGSVQFPLDRPLPLPLIRRMTAFRVREVVVLGGKWRT